MMPKAVSRHRHPRLLPGLLLACLLAVSGTAHSGATPVNLTAMIGSRDSLLVTDPTGRTVVAKNADSLLVPASVTKVLTALFALHALGPDFRFYTDFYLDAESNLVIKGYGDPLLVSEVVAEAAEELARRITRVRGIILDDSYFSAPVLVPGAAARSLEPYDAPNGGLCVNFNSVAFRKDPGTGRYVSAEPQTPLVPVVLPRIRSTKLASGRILLTNEGHEAVLYAGHLFDHFLTKAGIQTGRTVRPGSVRTESSRLLYRQVSPYPLAEVIERMLYFSNNYIANQLFIAAGAGQFGPPGNLDKGVRAITGYADRILGIKGLRIEEGSGLSRGNRLSARMLEKILTAFEPHRRLMRKENGQYFKTGTLSGVQTRAGYVETETGRPFRFVIMINTPGKSVVPVMTRLFQALRSGADLK
ncbi:MAG: D-alanyl-D-alanine carboxypeptidase/D-alanyl-D-alanine-endopeptidase [Thermodesulfobacteriota bacterium]